MSPLLLLLAVRQGEFYQQKLGGTDEKPAFMLRWSDDALDPAKLSPKSFGTPPQRWEYDWLTAGYADLDDEPAELRLRFRVYSQLRAKDDDRAKAVTRMLLRLHSLIEPLGLGHDENYNAGAIDVYLSWGGKPGGEYGLMVDTQGPRPRQVPAIFLYDLASFTDPAESAREVAHEYGHAVLPPVGGYTAPEDWANGILGERLLMDSLRRAKLSGDDAMGLPPEAIAKWCDKHVEPRIARARAAGPFDPELLRRDARGMDAYTGLVLWSRRFLSDRTFGRSLQFVGTLRASGVPRAIADAAMELPEYGADAPGGVPIWLPLAPNRKVVGGKILLRREGWAKIQPTARRIDVKSG